MTKKYANIELKIKSENSLVLGNTANYKKLANWNNSTNGNVTNANSGIHNGNPSAYGLYDTFGQVYEWTETSDVNFNQLKIVRGGCYADETAEDLRSIKKFLYSNMLEEGCFGFRVASSGNPNSLSDFINVSGSFNDISYDLNMYEEANSTCNSLPNNNLVDTKSLDKLGLVPYSYDISKYLVSNSEYCQYLNSVDFNGNNKEVFDYRMDISPIGGIHLKQSYEYPTVGQYYVTKNNMANKPVTFVTWEMAARYCNWLHNNKQNNINSTISGTYDLSSLNRNVSVIDIEAATSKQLSFIDKQRMFGEMYAPGLPPLSIDGVELKLNDLVLIKNENDQRLNGIYYVGVHTVTTDNPYYYKLYRNTSYTTGGTIVKIKKGKTQKNKKFIVGVTGQSIFFGETLGLPFSASVPIPVIEYLHRSPSGLYFLPTNNEWHKAALYDSELDKFWKYGTKSDQPPLPVISDSTGEPQYPAGYFHPSEKTFPIIITKDKNNETNDSSIFTANIEYSTPPASFQNSLYFVHVDVTGIKSGELYNYNFNSGSSTDWPAYIHPLTGSFVSDSDNYTINGVLRFCPVSRRSNSGITCNSNLSFTLSDEKVNGIAEQGTGILDLIVVVSGTSGTIQNNKTITATNLPILPREDLVDIKILTPSGTPNSIVVSGNMCDSYIPIVAIAKTGNMHTKLAEEYTYKFYSDNPNVSIIPPSGRFSLADPYTKITSILKLNGTENCTLHIDVSHPTSSRPRTDYVSIVCLDKCGGDYFTSPNNPGANPIPPTTTHLFNISSILSKVPADYLNSFVNAANRWNTQIKYDDSIRSSISQYIPNWDGLELVNCTVINENSNVIASCSVDTFVDLVQGNQSIKMNAIKYNVTINEYYKTYFSSSDWNNIFTHELGHALGIGILWHPFYSSYGAVPPVDNILNLSGNFYPEAQTKYNEITVLNVTGIPLENAGGAGTISAHWENDYRESTGDYPIYYGLSDELMVGTYSLGARRVISELSTNVLKDFGYVPISTGEGIPTVVSSALTMQQTESIRLSCNCNQNQPEIIKINIG